ncbi:unnamed protein product [Amoebophrya sp. A120]|nr:unnamed protein product [Amoebophrya sp. A120]|eukprot:GSA120T00005077001.1
MQPLNDFASSPDNDEIEAPARLSALSGATSISSLHGGLPPPIDDLDLDLLYPPQSASGLADGDENCLADDDGFEIQQKVHREGQPQPFVAATSREGTAIDTSVEVDFYNARSYDETGFAADAGNRNILPVGTTWSATSPAESHFSIRMPALSKDSATISSPGEIYHDAGTPAPQLTPSAECFEDAAEVEVLRQHVPEDATRNLPASLELSCAASKVAMRLPPGMGLAEDDESEQDAAAANVGCKGIAPTLAPAGVLLQQEGVGAGAFLEANAALKYGIHEQETAQAYLTKEGQQDEALYLTKRPLSTSASKATTKDTAQLGTDSVSLPTSKQSTSLFLPSKQGCEHYSAHLSPRDHDIGEAENVEQAIAAKSSPDEARPRPQKKEYAMGTNFVVECPESESSPEVDKNERGEAGAPSSTRSRAPTDWESAWATKFPAGKRRSEDSIASALTQKSHQTARVNPGPVTPQQSVSVSVSCEASNFKPAPTLHGEHHATQQHHAPKISFEGDAVQNMIKVSEQKQTQATALKMEKQKSLSSSVSSAPLPQPMGRLRSSSSWSSQRSSFDGAERDGRGQNVNAEIQDAERFIEEQYREFCAYKQNQKARAEQVKREKGSCYQSRAKNDQENDDEGHWKHDKWEEDCGLGGGTNANTNRTPDPRVEHVEPTREKNASSSSRHRDHDSDTYRAFSSGWSSRKKNNAEWWESEKQKDKEDDTGKSRKNQDEEEERNSSWKTSSRSRGEPAEYYQKREVDGWDDDKKQGWQSDKHTNNSCWWERNEKQQDHSYKNSWNDEKQDRSTSTSSSSWKSSSQWWNKEDYTWQKKGWEEEQTQNNPSKNSEGEKNSSNSWKRWSEEDGREEDWSSSWGRKAGGDQNASTSASSSSSSSSSWNNQNGSWNTRRENRNHDWKEKGLDDGEENTQPWWDEKDDKEMKKYGPQQHDGKQQKHENLTSGSQSRSSWNEQEKDYGHDDHTDTAVGKTRSSPNGNAEERVKPWSAAFTTSGGVKMKRARPPSTTANVVKQVLDDENTTSSKTVLTTRDGVEMKNSVPRQQELKAQPVPARKGNSSTSTPAKRWQPTTDFPPGPGFHHNSENFPKCAYFENELESWGVEPGDTSCGKSPTARTKKTPLSSVHFSTVHFTGQYLRDSASKKTHIACPELAALFPTISLPTLSFLHLPEGAVLAFQVQMDPSGAACLRFKHGSELPPQNLNQRGFVGTVKGEGKSLTIGCVGVRALHLNDAKLNESGTPEDLKPGDIVSFQIQRGPDGYGTVEALPYVAPGSVKRVINTSLQ